MSLKPCVYFYLHHISVHTGHIAGTQWPHVASGNRYISKSSRPKFFTSLEIG